VVKNYRYPEQCCGNCTKSYQSTYGDYQCKLVSGGLIDVGAVCDEYEKDTTAGTLVLRSQDTPAEPLPTEIHNSEKNACDICAYSFFGEDNVPRCAQSGKAISDFKARCRRYKPVETASGENILEEEPLEDTLDEPIIEGEITEEQLEVYEDNSASSCENCAYAKYIEGLPWCLCHAGQLDLDDLSPCEQWAQEGSIVIIEEG
jgi:hypothetical protein